MTRKKPTRNPKVVLVDVNCVLHIWDKAPHSRNFSITDVNGKIIRTGGITGIINILRRIDYDVYTDIFVFCFDRSSFRKQLSASLGIPYKSGRERLLPELKVGSDLLYEWLPKMGFNALALDGLEADDIISSIATHAQGYGIEVDIISTDRDLAIRVDEKTRLVSPSTRVPTVDFENYAYTIGAAKGHTIPYNSIVLYKSICGDDSDKIPPVVRQSYAMFRRIINKLEEHKFDLPSLTEYDNVEKVLDALEEPVRTLAKNNLELIKMKHLDAEQVPMKKLDLNKEAVLQFATIINSKNLAKKFGMVITEYPEYVMKTRLEITKKIAEKSEAIVYVKEEESEVETSTAEQALTDIENEQKFYQNVADKFAPAQGTESQEEEDKEQEQTSGNEEIEEDSYTPTINPDALE